MEGQTSIPSLVWQGNITLDVESRSSVSLVQHLAVNIGVLVSKMEESIAAQDHAGTVPSVS